MKFLDRVEELRNKGRSKTKVKDPSTKQQLVINQEQSLSVIPNSCLSILFLPIQQFEIPEPDMHMKFNLHYNNVPSLDLYGKFYLLNFNNSNLEEVSDNVKRTKHNETFDVTLKVFVTNNYSNITGSIDGFLGIGPCPQGLIDNQYSFAHELIQYYKKNEFIPDKEDNKYFDSIEWIISSPW